MKQCRYVMLLSIIIVLLACSRDNAKLIREELQKEPPDLKKIVQYAEAGANLDELIYQDKPLLLYFAEIDSEQAVEAALAAGSNPVFENYSDKHAFLSFTLKSGNYARQKKWLSLITEKQDVYTHLAYLCTRLRPDTEKQLEAIDIIKYGTQESDTKALQLLADFYPSSPALFQKALNAADSAALKIMIDKDYSLSAADILRVQKILNPEFLNYCLDNTKTASIDQSINAVLNELTRETLMLLYPRTSMHSSLNEGLIRQLINNGQYDLAAYIINYSSASTVYSIDTAVAEIASFLNSKPYLGNDKVYTAQDLTVPLNVDNALHSLGVSSYMLYRNELFGRKGYVFKTPVLNRIFQAADWYKAKSNIMFADLGASEKRNVEAIKSIEDVYDYKQITRWMNEKPYTGDETLYTRESDYQVPADVLLALNHLGFNPSNLLRHEIYCRNGYIPSNEKLAKIFSPAVWYKAEDSGLPELDQTEASNVALLQFREWIEIIDSQKQRLPDDIVTVPVTGYNSLMLKKITYGGEEYYYSTHMLDAALAVNEKIFSNKKKSSDGITDQVKEQITAASDPVKALQIYFENKRYRGYTDTVIYRRTDMQAPEYLQDAIEKAGADWLVLLKKEIHARHGAMFTDPLAGEIFRGCSWYSEKHNLVLNTVSRLPQEEKVTREEEINFCLVEGEDLNIKRGRYPGKVTTFDLNGNVYLIRIALVELDYGDKAFYSAYGYTDEEEYADSNLLDTINNALSEYNTIIEEISDEYLYDSVGC